MWNTFKLKMISALLWCVRQVRGEPPALLEVNLPGLELQHLWWRFYWLRIDVGQLCAFHHAQVEATASDPQFDRSLPWPPWLHPGRDLKVHSDPGILPCSWSINEAHGSAGHAPDPSPLDPHP